MKVSDSSEVSFVALASKPGLAKRDQSGALDPDSRTGA